MNQIAQARQRLEHAAGLAQVPALVVAPALAPTYIRNSGIWQIAYGLMKSAEIGRPVDFKRSEDLDLGGVIGSEIGVGAGRLVLLIDRDVVDGRPMDSSGSLRCIGCLTITRTLRSYSTWNPRPSRTRVLPLPATRAG